MRDLLIIVYIFGLLSILLVPTFAALFGIIAAPAAVFVAFGGAYVWRNTARRLGV